MQPTTLKGIFPDRKVVHRKNFIKENVRKIKQLQEFVNQGFSDTKITDKQVVVPKVSSQIPKSNTSSHKLPEDDPKNLKVIVRKPGIQKLEIKPASKKNLRPEKFIQQIEKVPVVPPQEERIIHRSMQTEATDNLEVIYSTGIIKYPSAPILNNMVQKTKRMFRKNDHSHGDSQNNLEDLNHKDGKTDYIKQNMLIKGRNLRKETAPDPTKVPPTYKKGVVPKYIKQKKEVSSEDTADIKCPPGHVLLPEEERKETLKVLRESYAEKIQELNAMPVRSDTMKMQKRKMELEAELKKIDEGIKVFQRPKVFVRICV